MRSARDMRRPLAVMALFLASAFSETGMQNPNQPQPPPPGPGGGAAPAAKAAKPVVKHPPASVTVGVFRPADATFLLRNTNADGEPDVTVAFGQKDDLPV